MKIIHIITGLSTGGAERALYNLLQGGLSRRFESHVVSMMDGGTLGCCIQSLGVPVTALGMPGGRPSFKGLARLRRVVREFRPDLIHGWMYHGNLAATLAKAFCDQQTVLLWNVRQSLYDVKNEKLLTRQVIRLNRLFSSLVDTLLYNSKLSRLQHEAFGFSTENGRIIPNGIDLQKFNIDSAHGMRTRRDLGIPADASVVGHVARFHPMKDHALFLHASVHLASHHPTTHFLLAGRDVTYENEAIRQAIPDYIQDRFHFLGERRDVPEIMAAMDVFCLSSWSEAFPNVVGEAMASRLPCVVTDVGDSAFVVDDTGLVVPSGKESALVEGIEKLLAMTDEERQALGARARNRIETHFSLSSIVGQYAALYEKVIKQKGVH